MVELTKERDTALRNTANEVARLLGDKYKIIITCSHDFDTGVSKLLVVVEIPVYEEPEVRA